MARINRFYLLIAALIMSRTNSVYAASCYYANYNIGSYRNITSTDTLWSDYINVSVIRNASGTGSATKGECYVCYSGTTYSDMVAHKSNLNNIYKNYCSSIHIINKNASQSTVPTVTFDTAPSCFGVHATNEGALYEGWVCDDHGDWERRAPCNFSNAELYDTYDNLPASSHVDEKSIYTGTCPVDSSLCDSFGCKKTVCSCGDSEDGKDYVVKYTPTNGIVSFSNQSAADCICVIDDPDDGGSGGTEPPKTITCNSGYYFDYIDEMCEKCPDYSVYNTTNGAFIKTYAGIVTSPQKTYSPNGGSDSSIDLCYVPKGTALYTDNSGTFKFDSNCPYYGAGTF